MSDFIEYDPGSWGYEVERLRREGYALADEVEAEGETFAAAFIRDEYRRWYDECHRRMDEARDASLRELGVIP